MVTTDMLQSGHYMSWKHFVTLETTSGDTLSPQNNASRKWLQKMLQLGHYMSWKHFVTSEITNGDTLSPQNNASGKWSEQETNTATRSISFARPICMVF